MKKINDEKIIKLVKENNNYSIKTTSQNILNQYKYEMNLEAQKAPKKSHKKAITIGSICGSLGLASAALVAVIVIGVTPDSSKKQTLDSTTLPSVINPVTNEGLKKQLITFSAFTPNESPKKLNLNRILKANILKESSDNESDNENDNETDDVITENDVLTTVNLYEGVEKSVNYLYQGDKVKIKNVEVDETYNNINYKFVTEFRLSDDSEPFAKYYFNEDTRRVSDSDFEFQTTAYYKTLDQEFTVDVEEKKETSEDESEAETTLVFRDAKNIDKKVYLIAKENEVETESGKTSSENEFKIETYASESDFKEEKYLKKVSAETEVENKESEMSVKIKDSNSEVKYKISKQDEKNLTLKISYERLDTDFEFSDLIIKLQYTETERIYTWNETSIWKFKINGEI